MGFWRSALRERDTNRIISRMLGKLPMHLPAMLRFGEGSMQRVRVS